jgi:small-conductance mechanosensitive channel
MADANSIQPITSDASAYYAAKNEAIKNARAYTSKLDTTINDIVHQTNEENKDIAFENAVRRTENANTNAKYIHEWDIEQKQGNVDYIEARNQSFQALNKEVKHNIVTEARRKQKQRDAYVNKHILTGITTSPSNYINGWTKHHDLIWYKG